MRFKNIQEHQRNQMNFFQKAKFDIGKRGVLGLDTVRDVLIFLLTLAVIAIAVFLALTSLQDASLFTAGSQTAADVNSIIGNITSGTVGFFSNIPTVFTILGAVVIILAVTLILFAVNRFSQGTGGTGSL